METHSDIDRDSDTDGCGDRDTFSHPCRISCSWAGVKVRPGETSQAENRQQRQGETEK